MRVNASEKFPLTIIVGMLESGTVDSATVRGTAGDWVENEKVAVLPACAYCDCVKSLLNDNVRDWPK